MNHDPVMITYAHLSKEPPKPSERKPELPAGLDAIVAQGMAKDPAKRPESAGALIAAAAMVLRTASTPSVAAAVPTLAPAPPASTAAAPASTAAAPVPAPAAAAPQPATPDLAPLPETARPSAARTAWTVPLPVAAPVAAEPPRPRTPLSAWLVPLGPVLLVFVVAAVFGALLGTPGSGSQQAANTVRSPEQRAVQRLDGVRFRLRDDLAFAGTPDEQADAAQRLAMAYGRAADHLVSPGLVSAAQDASVAYLAVESAARAGDQDAYDSARARVEAAEKQVASELAQINRSRAAR